MSLRSVARVFLALVLVADVLAVAALMTGETIGVVSADERPAAEEPPAESTPSAEALLALGRELVARKAELERQEAELEELLRGSEVLRRAGLLPDAEERTAAFGSLQRAYEHMEPESAARALAVLAQRDEEAVVQLLLGWKPRTSGAILDALTQTDPALAADLSYAIWKREEP